MEKSFSFLNSSQYELLLRRFYHYEHKDLCKESQGFIIYNESDSTILLGNLVFLGFFFVYFVVKPPECNKLRLVFDN